MNPSRITLYLASQKTTSGMRCSAARLGALGRMARQSMEWALNLDCAIPVESTSTLKRPSASRPSASRK
eukprot:7747537-Pyramimonas_sp.AAC.1